MRGKGVKKLAKYISIEISNNYVDSFKPVSKKLGIIKMLNLLFILSIILICFMKRELIEMHYKNIYSKFLVKDIIWSGDYEYYEPLNKELVGDFIYNAQFRAGYYMKKNNAVKTASLKTQNNILYIDVLERPSVIILQINNEFLFIDENGEIIKRSEYLSQPLNKIKIYDDGILKILNELIPKFIMLDFLNEISSIKYSNTKRLDIFTKDNILIKVKLSELIDSILLFKNKKGFFLQFNVIDFRLFPDKIYTK